MTVDYQLITSLLIAGFAAFLTTFARGFQNKNVAAGYKKLAFGVGAGMAMMDGFVIVMVAKSGLSVLPATALGAGLGWVVGMVFHDMMTAKARAEFKRLKKAKRKAQIIKVMRSLQDDAR